LNEAGDSLAAIENASDEALKEANEEINWRVAIKYDSART
jgi:hypothetical protein